MAMAWRSMSVANTCSLKRLLQLLHALLEQDGEGVGLLAGGTAGHPDANRRSRGLAGKKLGNDLFLEQPRMPPGRGRNW